MKKFERDVKAVKLALEQRARLFGELVTLTELKENEIEYILSCLVEDDIVGLDVTEKLKVEVYWLKRRKNNGLVQTQEK